MALLPEPMRARGSVVIGDPGHIGGGEPAGRVGVPLLDLGNDSGLCIFALGLGVQAPDGHGDIGGGDGCTAAASTNASSLFTVFLIYFLLVDCLVLTNFHGK